VRRTGHHTLGMISRPCVSLMQVSSWLPCPACYQPVHVCLPLCMCCVGYVGGVQVQAVEAVGDKCNT
jgi:hypothetical protein